MAARWLPLALVAAATVAGAWVRIALAASSGLWRDEVQSLAVSRLPTIRDMLSFLVHEESHPPLFYLLERAWTSVVGTSDAAVVALGMVPGLALIPFAGWAAWRLGGRWAGALAAWLVALAWPLVWQAGDGRPYALLSVLTLGASVAAVLALESGRRVVWASYTACAVAMLYTHAWSALVVATLGLLTLEAAWRDRGARKERLRTWAVVHGVIAAAGLPWLPALLIQVGNAGYPPRAGFPIAWLVITPITLLALTVKLFLPGVATILIGAWRGRGDPSPSPRPRFLASTAVVACILAALAWPVTNLMIIHCAHVLVPGVMVAIALALATGPASGPTAARRMIASLCMAGLLATALRSWSPAKSNLREAARAMDRALDPGDLVVVYPSTLAPSVRRYATTDVEMVTYPLRMEAGPTRFSRYVESFDDPAELQQVLARIAERAPAACRVWLVRQVLTSRMPDSPGKPGTTEYWRHRYESGLRELRESLRGSFGPPDLEFAAAESLLVRERVTVEGYRAAGVRDGRCGGAG